MSDEPSVSILRSHLAELIALGKQADGLVAVAGVRWCPVHRGVAAEANGNFQACERYVIHGGQPCHLRPLFFRQEPTQPKASNK